jgi:AbrB family looped-hinge helix DNA binding protein
MKSTIDSAGRIVIPRDIRVGAGLLPDTPVEIRLRGGIVEIEPAPVNVRFVRKGRLQVAVPAEKTEPLKEETVARVRRRIRKDE